MKKLLYCFYILLVTFLLAEGGHRLYFTITKGYSLFYSTKDLVYPELLTSLAKYDKRDRNVLLLGASTIDFAFKSGAFDMIEGFKFYSVAVPGHTSRDSLHKYRELLQRGYLFQYVVFYHAINETRFNNIPNEEFKKDYSHIPFYNEINPLFSMSNFFRWVIMNSSLGFHVTFVGYKDSIHDNRSKFWNEGGEIKTISSFQENLQKLARLAKQYHQDLIVPLYAYHLPSEKEEEKLSSPEMFQMIDPDHGWPTKIWGDRKNVVDGIVAHNKVILSLRGGFTFVDTTEFTKQSENFIDICHHSDLGKRKFVQLIKSVIK